jgi:hypothetical protein
VADTQDPAVFAFDGSWPFTGDVIVNRHKITTVSSWDVHAAADGIPVVTLTLVGAGALKLILGSDAARAEVSDETREALISLGWTPPAGHR